MQNSFDLLVKGDFKTVLKGFADVSKKFEDLSKKNLVLHLIRALRN